MGATLGSYVLERKLGVGAFGVVWLAQHQAGRKVAIKVLHPAAASSHESVERFRREAYVLSQMKSPHIAEMYEFLNLPGMGPRARDGVRGRRAPFARKLQSHQASAWSTPFTWAWIFFAASREMHKHGIIHRDLKPENVILRPATKDGEDGRWRAVIFDFNLSRLKNQIPRAPRKPPRRGQSHRDGLGDRHRFIHGTGAAPGCTARERSPRISTPSARSSINACGWRSPVRRRQRACVKSCSKRRRRWSPRVARIPMAVGFERVDDARGETSDLTERFTNAGGNGQLRSRACSPE